MKINEIINHYEIYTISLYHSQLNYDSFLEVVSSTYEFEALKSVKPLNSILKIELELSCGKLNNSINRHLEYVKCMDKEFNKKIFKYKVNNLDKIKFEINKYKKIRLWIDKNDSNSYLILLFFCNEFYDLLKNKEVIVVNIDNFYESSISLDEILKNKLKEKVLLPKEIKKIV